MKSKHLIIGTAGHIDHGKTSLVKALTGTDTDRLKEEKKRGITIELGFAYMELNDTLTVSFIDVPGHEGFIRHMLAGVGGIDAAMLVVAADESVMPQTTEHFNICRLMGIKKGLVVITKASLAPDLVEMVEMEIAELTLGSFLENAPVVRVDSISGEGIEELKIAIADMSEGISARKAEGAFLLHIDRAFNMKGFGAVVTGTCVRGKVQKGQSLELLPGKTTVRVRNIQVNDREVSETSAGFRSALNLQDVSLEEIERGMSLAEPAVYNSTDTLDTVIEMTPGSPVPLKENDRIRFHHGAKEIMGRIRLLGGKSIEPGKVGAVQVKLEEKTTAICGDRFVIRRYSPPTTIGGGVIADSMPRRGGRFSSDAAEMLKSLPGSGCLQHIRYFCFRAGKTGVTLDSLAARLGLKKDEVQAVVAEGKDLIFLGENPRVLFNINSVNVIEKSLRDCLKNFHSENPSKPGLPKGVLKNMVFRFGTDRIFEDIAGRLEKSGEIKTSKEFIALASHKIFLSDVEVMQKEKLEALFMNAIPEPPSPEEAIKISGAGAAEVMKILIREGQLVKLDQNLIFHRKVIDKIKKDVTVFGKTKELITFSDFKELTGLSRKYSVPLMEYLDREKITVRIEGGRKLRDR